MFFFFRYWNYEYIITDILDIFFIHILWILIRFLIRVEFGNAALVPTSNLGSVVGRFSGVIGVNKNVISKLSTANSCSH